MNIKVTVLEQSHKPRLKVMRYKVRFNHVNYLGKMRALTIEIDYKEKFTPTLESFYESFAGIICAGSGSPSHYVEFYDGDSDYDCSDSDYINHKLIYEKATRFFEDNSKENATLKKFTTKFYDEEWLAIK